MTLERHHTRTSEPPPLFRSFWIAGFDAADHSGALPVPLGAVDAARYRERVEADYRALGNVGIACVRESIDWRRIDRGARHDFETVRMRAECAAGLGIQIIWTLCHSGLPDDVDVRSHAFVDRFRRFAAAAARVIVACSDGAPLVVAPVNEISFLSWALCETNLFSAQRIDPGEGYAVRQQFVRAALAACDAILEIDPHARFLHTEPVSNMGGRRGASGAPEDGGRPDVRFQTWDMLAGRLEPQLGGHPRYLDLVGLHCHQGEQPWRGTVEPAFARASDLPRFALHRLLADVHAHYGRPIVAGETSRLGPVRAAWLRDFGGELCEALEQGVPVPGACVCRAIERPAWEDPRYWRGRRLWDVLLDARDGMPRVRNSACEQALRDMQARIDPLLAASHNRHTS